ncbi:MAG: hypothetical protein RL262_564, partial [Bacteroidota bacterium]
TRQPARDVRRELCRATMTLKGFELKNNVQSKKSQSKEGQNKSDAAKSKIKESWACKS